MIIETKFNLDDFVWAILDNKIKKREIVRITSDNSIYSAPRLHYYLYGYATYHYNEDELFKTKEELIASL